jgi:AcrR family transcriptional regulator
VTLIEFDVLGPISMNTAKTKRKVKARPAEKRSYQSGLRKQQAEQTRELIIEALAEQVWQEGLADFSVPKVARRAGVATRTIYRYFPTRDDLLDAVGEWIRKHAPEPVPPQHLDDVLRYVRELYGYFDAHPQLVDLQALPGLGREIQERWRAQRAVKSRARLSKWMPEIDDEHERLRRFAPIRVLLGSRCWLQMTRELGFTSEQATDVACDAIATLLRSYRAGE